MGQTKIVMKRALRGLYAGRHIQFGNKISEDGGNKSRRSWKPNRQKKRLFSFGLDGYVRLDVTTHALRCIDRVGGLDEYLLKLPLKEIHSEKILHLRQRIAERYDKKTMLPRDLEKKIKAVLEWNIEQKGKKAEEVEETEDDTEDEEFPAPSLEGGEQDYLDKLFAKFTVKQEEKPESQVAKEEVPAPYGTPGPAPYGIPGIDDVGEASEPRPRPKPEEFPETLFT